MFVNDALAGGLICGSQGLGRVADDLVVDRWFAGLGELKQRALDEEKKLVLPLCQTGDQRQDELRIAFLLALARGRRVCLGRREIPAV